MSLRDTVSEYILEGIFNALHQPGSWKSIEKERTPLTHLEAIYIAQPTEANVNKIIADFDRPADPKNLYKSLHIFFLQKCPVSLFSKLGDSLAGRRIKTLKEINLAFLPYESRVFSLDDPDGFEDYFCQSGRRRDELYSAYADQLATVCSLLGEYPAVRAWKDGNNRCSELAYKLQEKLDYFKSQKPELGKGAKQVSEFIILDRGFDVVTPVLHELTVQCMVYDLLKPDNDVYQFKTSSGDGQTRQKQAILGENDDRWKELRHLHIADASKSISEGVKNFAKQKKLGGGSDGDVSIKELSKQIRRAPQYQKELSEYSLHLSLIDSCMNLYKKGVGNLCKVEQDLATGVDKDGLKIDEPLKIIMSSLFDRNVSVYDKIRLLILFILHKKGVPKDEFTKMVQHSEIPDSERTTITNLMHLGIQMITSESVRTGKSLTPKDRDEEAYIDARWSPVIRDIAEYAGEGKLDESYCPYIKSKPRPSSSVTASVTASTGGAGASSVRKRYNWIPTGDQKESKGSGASASSGASKASTTAGKDGPTIFIFVIGGISYSEMRTMYTVAEKSKDYNFIIGSTHFLTPNKFLGDLKRLPPFVRL
uniref:Uncharacterized protein n=1 Tax=Amphimedon queenslandica TaxID=400682 RepID=A0A1X7VB60_AMPQE